MKMYADYIKERLGDEIVIRDEGFATYRHTDFNGIASTYIIDIYVRPDFRKTKIASEMADEITKVACQMGSKQLIGSVVPSAKGSTDSARVLLSYGMSLHSCTNDFMLFKKEI